LSKFGDFLTNLLGIACQSNRFKHFLEAIPFTLFHCRVQGRFAVKSEAFLEADKLAQGVGDVATASDVDITGTVGAVAAPAGR
jgi:hypothetical protein